MTQRCNVSENNVRDLLFYCQAKSLTGIYIKFRCVTMFDVLSRLSEYPSMFMPPLMSSYPSISITILTAPSSCR